MEERLVDKQLAFSIESCDNLGCWSYRTDEFLGWILSFEGRVTAGFEQTEVVDLKPGLVRLGELICTALPDDTRALRGKTLSAEQSNEAVIADL